MGFTIYTATGCTRCKIIKQLMNEKGIAFEEQDMKAAGKEAFQKFYAANRKAIFRGPDGVEFPLLHDGITIRQGIGACVAYLLSGTKLDGFFSVGTLHKEWVDGIHVSGGNPEYTTEFLAALQYIKKGNNMKLQLDTNGLNSAILEQILAQDLADVVIMNVLGPKELYSQLAGEAVNITEVEKSLSLVTKFPEYKLQTTVAPVVREDGEISYLTTKEIGATAKFIAEATGSMKNPYLVKLFKPKECKDERFKTIEAMPANALLSYRTAARTHQVFVEIEKN
ncbi:glutaredoxin family protein [Desulforamulus aeronauticus]|uniref:Pyruvate formate lyase activating enzyme n=1 Tax=Desulforamulus aeronauticus DSM 10349 TaxID=1121421 RepID=A0A1M6S486_9FIRM|nr:hypothetical protein [Desulforamulus aeronauticus]SHK39297.1 pyruvate formate lyase activating enzyme [Desulforamulus aeronauticus DSM 10349]